MEGFTIVVSFVVIIFGVLQIILFFKLWGMTNDVKEIKNIMKPNSMLDLENQDSANAIKPNIEELYEIDKGELNIGDFVVRNSDAKEMIIDRIVYGRYGCIDAKSHIFISGYNREEISKVKKKELV